MFVYKFLDKNKELLYIGKTIRTMSVRMAQHFNGGHLSRDEYKNVHSILYHECTSRQDMSIRETYLISVLNPKYNTVNNRGSRFDFEINGFDWKVFDINSVTTARVLDKFIENPTVIKFNENHHRAPPLPQDEFISKEGIRFKELSLIEPFRYPYRYEYFKMNGTHVIALGDLFTNKTSIVIGYIYRFTQDDKYVYLYDRFQDDLVGTLDYAEVGEYLFPVEILN